MEQMPKSRDFHKRGRYPSRKKGFWKLGEAAESENVSSLPGKYLLNDSNSSHHTGSKTSEPPTWGGKWYLETPELKKRTYKNTQLDHDSSRYNKNLSRPSSTSQSDYDMSYEMFPPLKSQMNVIKTEKDHARRSQTATQIKESKQSCWKDGSKDYTGRTQHLKNERNFEVQQGENKPKWPLSNFWNAKQDGVKKTHNTASLYEKETNVDVRRSTISTRMTDNVKTDCGSNSLRDLRSGLKGNVQDTKKDLTPADSKDIQSKHFLLSNQSHSKKDGGVQSTFPKANNTKKAQENESMEGNLIYSGNRCTRRSSVLQQSHTEPSLDKDDTSCDSYTAQLYDDSSEDATVSRKNDLLSYLKLILKTQNQESPNINEIVESKCVPSSESPVTDETQESQTKTEIIPPKREEKLDPEDQLLCEEMLNNYIVLTNLPFGVSKEELLYHITKVGPVSYLIMENNKAHVIFLKPEHAEAAFGTKHVLFGKDLVVYRPKRPSCTLHLSGLTNNTPNKDIIDEMSKYGLLLSFYRPVHKITGALMQYCFVKVGKEVAESILNQTSLSVNGVRVFVEVSSHSEILPQVPQTRQTPSVVPRSHIERNPDGYKVWFSNVPRLASYDLIKEHFQEFGRLHKVFVRNRRGFVIFASQDGVDQAMSSRHTILGSEVKISRGSMVPY